MFQFFSYIGLYVPSVGTWMSQESKIWEHVYTKLVARDYFSYSVTSSQLIQDRYPNLLSCSVQLLSLCPLGHSGILGGKKWAVWCGGSVQTLEPTLSQSWITREELLFGALCFAASGRKRVISQSDKKWSWGHYLT